MHTPRWLFGRGSPKPLAQQSNTETGTSGCAGRPHWSEATGGGLHTPRWRFVRGSSNNARPQMAACEGQGRWQRQGVRTAGWLAIQSFRTVLTRVCHPGPLARRADTSSWSRRMATCSLAGFLLGPRVLRKPPSVAATPPPCVAVACCQSILLLPGVLTGAAAFAAAICWRLKRVEEGIGFFSIGITAGNDVRGLFAARGPHQKDDPPLPHAQALYPEFAVALASIFHGDHGLIENRFEFSQVKPVLFDVLAPLWFVPRDH